jgi:hypothetical protein
MQQQQQQQQQQATITSPSITPSAEVNFILLFTFAPWK